MKLRYVGKTVKILIKNIRLLACARNRIRHVTGISQNLLSPRKSTTESSFQKNKNGAILSSVLGISQH